MQHAIEFREDGVWTCPDCGVPVIGKVGKNYVHACAPKHSRERVAQGFEEVSNPERPSWLHQVEPSDELRARMKRQAAYLDLGVEIEVAWENSKVKRAILVFDPSLPESMRRTYRELGPLEDWEVVFRELGLIR